VILPIANKGLSSSLQARPRPSGRQDSLHEAARIQQKILAKAEIIVGSANKLWRMRLAPSPLVLSDLFAFAYIIGWSATLTKLLSLGCETVVDLDE
jgi:hypothetical protein